LLRGLCSTRKVFRNEGHVAIEVDSVPVAECSEKPGFRSPLRHFLSDLCTDPAFVEPTFLRLPEKLVDLSHLEEDSAVHGLVEGIIGVPGHRIKVLDGLVIPRDDGLVGRQLLELPEQPHVLRRADIRHARLNVYLLSAAYVLARRAQPGVQLR
jgi:hypothetical protein